MTLQPRRRANEPQPIKLAVIDLDNTLYHADSGVFSRMDKRMTAFIAHELAIPHAEANRLRIDYWRKYGTTLKGLMLHHQMEAEPFLHDVHQIHAHELLTSDSMLNQALGQLPCRKIIHTNGIREHAERILDALAIRHHFSAIYDIRFNHYQPKPCSDTLRQLIAQEGFSSRNTIVVDDMPGNLAAARAIGCTTAWISPDQNAQWDYQVKHFHQLPALLTQQLPSTL